LGGCGGGGGDDGERGDAEGKKKRLTASEAANGTRMNVGRWRENMVKPRLTYLSVTSEYR
jgi:hypothetical protein